MNVINDAPNVQQMRRRMRTSERRIYSMCSLQRRTIFLFLYWICMFTTLLDTSADAFHFYLDAGQKRCFSDSASPNTKILIEYTVSTGNGVMPVDLTVSLNDGQKDVLIQDNVEHGKAAFVLPYPEEDDLDHLYHAEALRKRRQHRIPKKSSHHYDDKNLLNIEPHHVGHSRHILSIDDDVKKRKADDYKHHEHLYDEKYDDLNDDIDDLELDDYEGIDDSKLNADRDKNDLKFSEHETIRKTMEHKSEIDATEAQEEEVFSQRKFQVCIFNVADNNKDNPQRRRIRLVIRKGDSALDYARLAKIQHMSQLETSLKRISDELHQLMIELDRTQQMEDVLYRLNLGTNNQVVILGVLSLVVMITVAAYQATYTRQYFKRKKIL